MEREIDFDPVDGTNLADQQIPQVMHFSVNNIQDLGILLDIFIDVAKDMSPDGEKNSLSIMQALLKGIEKLYKQNPTKLVQFIQDNREKLTLEQQNMFDACLEKCKNDSRFFASRCKTVARCKNAVFYAVYYSFAALIIIMFLEKKGYEIGSATDPEHIMAKLDNFISVALQRFYL